MATGDIEDSFMPAVDINAAAVRIVARRFVVRYVTPGHPECPVNIDAAAVAARHVFGDTAAPEHAFSGIIDVDAASPLSVSSRDLSTVVSAGIYYGELAVDSNHLAVSIGAAL